MGWMYEIKAEWVHQQTYTTVRKKNIAFAGGETVIFYTLTPPRPKVLHFHNMYITIGQLDAFIAFFVLNIE